jgi:hypothetical protein
MQMSNDMSVKVNSELQRRLAALYEEKRHMEAVLDNLNDAQEVLP